MSFTLGYVLFALIIGFQSVGFTQTTVPSAISMQPEYAEYDQKVVTYFNDALRDKKEVTIREGLFYDSKGRLASSMGDVLFVVDPKGRSYLFAEAFIKIFHHSSPVHGGPVVFAGTAVFEKGRLKKLTNASGHYKPNAAVFYRYLRYLESLEVDLSETEIYLANGRGKNAVFLSQGMAPKFMAGFETKKAAALSACAASF